MLEERPGYRRDLNAKRKDYNKNTAKDRGANRDLWSVTKKDHKGNSNRLF